MKRKFQYDIIWLMILYDLFRVDGAGGRVDVKEILI